MGQCSKLTKENQPARGMFLSRFDFCVNRLLVEVGVLGLESSYFKNAILS